MVSTNWSPDFTLAKLLAWRMLRFTCARASLVPVRNCIQNKDSIEAKILNPEILGVEIFFIITILYTSN